MGEDNIRDHQILFFHCSITCLYFSGIFIYFYFSDKLDNVGLYKLIFVLSTFLFVEFIKFYFTTYQADYLSLKKLESNTLIKTKKTFIKTLKDIIKFITAVATITIIYHVTIILFGAPLLTHCKETLMLAFTLTILTLAPASLHLGTDNALFLFVDLQLSVGGTIVDAIKLNIKTVLLTTWFSSFVIPLDWDRPWQIWPVPCIIGAFIGYFVAHFITLAKISKINFKEKKKNEIFKSC